MRLEHFEIKEMIGKGAFGRVYLVQNCFTEKVYAMKQLFKGSFNDRKMIQQTLLEKQILCDEEHPFLMRMDYVFQTEDKISFIMPFIKGGEFLTYLNKQPTNQFTEDQARFYVMQVALALGHLHKKNVCYRDLKAKNILMREDGYLCLTDFGMAKMLEGDC